MDVRNPFTGEVFHLREYVAPLYSLFGPGGAVIAYKNFQEISRPLEPRASRPAAPHMGAYEVGPSAGWVESR